MNEDIKSWLENNLLNYKPTKIGFKIENIGDFMLVSEKDEVFDEEMNLILTESELEIKCDFRCFKFGSNYYYIPGNELKIKTFNVLKYLGNIDSDLCLPFLGIHGGFDILNGSRSYNDWCKKAKFLGVNILGITERNTLAGIMKFQLSCKKFGIQSVIGAQYTVKNGEELTQVKFYVKDERGWESLLLINKEVNVLNNGYIERSRLFELLSGLITIIDPKYLKFEHSLPYSLHCFKGDLFWQLDDVEFENDEKDKEFLLNVKEYIEQADFPPVLITDAYYLDKEEHISKELLNTIADKRDYKSFNQYFKSLNEIFDNLSVLFSNEEKFLNIFEKAYKNTEQISERCKFNVPTNKRLLPKYTMTKEESKLYKNNEDLFVHLIQEGLENKLAFKSNLEEYLERVELEYDVIAGNNFIDYFLILWDIIRWARSENILVGLGRGSAAGSLIAYLLDIVRIDPLEFGLIFERFLTHDRAKVSFPDIDTDFQGVRRDDVKRYMEQRYGVDRVCSVGTYTNLKIKQSFKDLSKMENVPFETSNYLTKIFDIEEGDWVDIFKTAVEKSTVKDFVKEHPELIENMRLILNQPKSRSIHACATIIVPNDKDIFTSIPVRLENKGEESIIVSEWEGGELESAGYLKEDILGIKQLDKYAFILDLVKKTTGDEIDIYNLNLYDNKVIDLFKEGMTGDVFHFGSKGLTMYCKQMKPDSIHDLIAAISLYRPGAMEVNSHNEYILRKTGESKFEYHFGMEEVTKETYGLIVYQEQVMKTFTVLADFSLSKADDIRRAIVKKKKELITDNKDMFIRKCVEKGCHEEEAKEIWHEVEVHAGYSFNKSHAAAYAVTGYIGQWLKYYYPLQFWTSAFEFDDTDPKKSNVDRFISEINRSNNGIKIMPPNINESGLTFTSNFKKNEIYWSLGKVRQVGEKALDTIFEERNKNGEFFSLGDFLDRINKRVCNKAVVLNLILSGAFDELEAINKIEQRGDLIYRYFDIMKSKEKPTEYNTSNKFWWQMEQKRVCGFGEIDFKYVIRNMTDLKVEDFIDAVDLQCGEYNRATVVVAGVVSFIKERSSKKVGEYCNLELNSNHEKINITIWNETYLQYQEELKNSIGKIIVFEGLCQYDSYREVYGVQSQEDSKIFII